MIYVTYFSLSSQYSIQPTTSISITMSVSVIILLDPPPVTSYNITSHHQINSAIFILTARLPRTYISLPVLDLDQSFHVSKLSYIICFGNTFHLTLIHMMYIASTLFIHVVPAANLPDRQTLPAIINLSEIFKQL